MGALLSQGRIMLSTVPKGTARVVFTAPEFGTFLCHPLMVDAAATAVQVGFITTLSKGECSRAQSAICCGVSSELYINIFNEFIVFKRRCFG